MGKEILYNVMKTIFGVIICPITKFVKTHENSAYRNNYPIRHEQEPFKITLRQFTNTQHSMYVVAAESFKEKNEYQLSENKYLPHTPI